MSGSIQYSIALRSNGADTDKQVTSKTHEYNIYENKNRIITRMLQLQATVKRFQFDLYVNLEGQHMLISSWSQKIIS